MPRSGQREDVVEGILTVHRDGYGFVRPDSDGGRRVESVFLPPEEAAKAVDQDRVLVQVQPSGDGRWKGRLMAVVRRTRRLLLGEYVQRGARAWVEPLERGLGPVEVPRTRCAAPGGIVKVGLSVTDGERPRLGEPLRGEVVAPLDAESDVSRDVLGLAYARGFADAFPAAAIEESEALSEVLPEGGAARGRRDLRELELVTIDGEDARDFDDAVWVGPAEAGWRLVVAIADVAHFVREGTALDDEARCRGTSVYLPGRVLPMLPERLSNELCSLKPGVDRLCVVADLLVDRHGATQRAAFYEAVMRSAARCTYDEVHRLLAGERVEGREGLTPMLARALELSRALGAMRRRRGAIDFELQETKVELAPDGSPLRLVRRERLESHRLVEEFMLAANEAVARSFSERGLPTVNRFHGSPDEEKLNRFVRLLGAHGIDVGKGPLTAARLAAVLRDLEGHPEQRVLHQLALRSMMQAYYTADASGHFGLGATDYLHFTSPIRRYPDLLVHRLLKRQWAGHADTSGDALAALAERLEPMAAQASERERAAMQVERDVQALYGCLLLERHLGETSSGTVTSLTAQGFFVELEGLLAEGFVRAETVARRCRLDEAVMRLRFDDGRIARVGQRVRVRVDAVDRTRRHVDLACLELGDAGATDGPQPATAADGPSAPSDPPRSDGSAPSPPVTRRRRR